MSCPSPTPSSPVSTLPAPRPSPRPWLFALQGWRRRVLFVSLYESIAIAFSIWGLAEMSGDGLAHAGVMRLAASALAIVWNLVFNAMLERWEARQFVRQCCFAR